MPRNSSGRGVAKRSGANWAAFGLVILSSLAFIDTWWNLWAAGAGSPAFMGAAAFWLPVAVGVGVIGSIALFFFSLGYLMPSSQEMAKMMNMWVMKAVFAVGIALTVWAWGSTMWAEMAMVGFILGFLGTWAGAKGMM